MSVDEFRKRCVAVALYDSFEGVRYEFEELDKQANPGGMDENKEPNEVINKP